MRRFRGAGGRYSRSSSTGEITAALRASHFRDCRTSSTILVSALGGRPTKSRAAALCFRSAGIRCFGLCAPAHSRCKARTPRVVGIDDWAWKRGHRYGTIVCDLERRRIIDVLPDREAATVEAWLSARPDMRVVSRDRGGGYGQAIARALPAAKEVADRWHLMENASSAFLDAVQKSMRSDPSGARGWRNRPDTSDLRRAHSV